MKARLLLAALAAAALPLSGAAPAQPNAAQRDWSHTVVQTPEGGFRIGNPDARVKVIEYLSMTCPHCATFAEDSRQPLIQNYVRSGRVSVEYRNYVLNGLDLAAALLARCGGTAAFLPVTDRLLASQAQWIGRFTGLSEAQRRELAALEPREGLPRVAELSGLSALAAERGVPAAQGRHCLADQAAFERLVEMARAADALGISGTPTFLINGARVDAGNWQALEPLIRQAGG